jgi:DNA primase catalytic subunit
MEDLRSMLDFMYMGKTKVAQEHVNRFLALGEELGVKGLVRNQQKEDKELDCVEKLLAKTDGKAKGTKRIKKIEENEMAIMDVKVEDGLISQDADCSFETEDSLI